MGFVPRGSIEPELYGPSIDDGPFGVECPIEPEMDDVVDVECEPVGGCCGGGGVPVIIPTDNGVELGTGKLVVGGGGGITE